MSDALVLFPHQLFAANVTLARGRHVFLVEDALYFRQYAFHQQKLVLHRASMRVHARELAHAAAGVEYVEAARAPTMRDAIDVIAGSGARVLHYIDPVDDWLQQRLVAAAGALGLELVAHDTPMFLASRGFIEAEFGRKQRPRMAAFYAAQRKSLDILVDDGKPVGGRWSFDVENRKRLPKDFAVPRVPRPRRTAEVTAAIESVAREFGDNPGRAEAFAYPVTRRDARAWLDDFVAQRLPAFGPYEDAIAAREPTLFHSMLSSSLNIGLVTPDEVVEAALAHAGCERVPLSSLEGFVRQVIGWREYMRASYVFKGRAQRTRNFWKHTRPLPRAFWTAKTGIEPVDTVIRRVLDHAYAHHIERLMVLGNFMLLCEFDPDDVYRWFMELFIDAYDWVMVPNVYGMALYADGGTIVTKPYVASSNYIRRMSDFAGGPWCEVWDALFWRFIAKHRDVFSRNPRLELMARQLDRMGPDRHAHHERTARAFLDRLA